MSNSENDSRCNEKQTLARGFYRSKMHQKQIEKNLNGMLIFLKSIIDPELFEYKKNIEETNWEESLLLKRQIMKIVAAKKKLKLDVTDQRKLKELDICHFENAIFDLEKNIFTSKENLVFDYDRLQIDEAMLNLEIERFKSIMLNSNKEKNGVKMGTSKVQRETKDLKYKTPEVSDYLQFLYGNGGHSGGWNMNDHQIFMKFYKKLNRTPGALVERIGSYLPEISKEEIRAHLDWYHEYLSKKETYKSAVEKWRTSQTKNQIKEPQIQKRISSAQKNGNSNQNLVDVKEKIKKWKIEKQAKMEEILKPIDDTKKDEAESKYREDMKLAVENWRINKIFEETARKEEAERMKQIDREMKAMQANRLIKEFQNQDKLFLERKKELNQLKVKAKSRNNLEMTSLVQVPRDPDRVFRATKQWLEKIKPEKRYTVPLPGWTIVPPINLSNIPKLAKPNWMISLPSINLKE